MVATGTGFVYVELVLQHSSILWLNIDAGVGVAICKPLSVIAGSHCCAWQTLTSAAIMSIVAFFGRNVIQFIYVIKFISISNRRSKTNKE